MSEKSLVFYKTWKAAIDEIPSDKDARAMYDAIVNYSTSGETPDFKFPYSSIFSIIKYEIDRSAEKYEKAKEDGAKGGRPGKWVDREEAEALFEKSKSWKSVADELGVDEKTLRKARYAWEKNGKNREKRKNLDVDIDVDSDDDPDKDKDHHKELINKDCRNAGSSANADPAPAEEEKSQWERMVESGEIERWRKSKG